MTWFLFLLIGFAVGYASGRSAAGKPFDSKKALIAFLIAAVIALLLSWIRAR